MLYLTLCRNTIWKPGISWMNFITTYCQSNMSFHAIPLESPSAKSDVFKSEFDNDLAVPLVSTAKNQHKIVAILQFHTVFTALQLRLWNKATEKEMIIIVSLQRTPISHKLLLLIFLNDPHLLAHFVSVFPNCSYYILKDPNKLRCI